MNPGHPVVQGYVLMLLVQKEDHGYSLLSRLPVGITPDSGGFYKRLRIMEDQGYLVSYWESSIEGPQTRIYRVTDAGRDYLAELAHKVLDEHMVVRRFIVDHDDYTLRYPRHD